MRQRTAKHKAPAEQFQQDLISLQINLMEYEFYANALGESFMRPFSRELVCRHCAVARKMDRYAREIGEPATYETSLLASLAAQQ